MLMCTTFYKLFFCIWAITAHMRQDSRNVHHRKDNVKIVQTPFLFFHLENWQWITQSTWHSHSNFNNKQARHWMKHIWTKYLYRKIRINKLCQYQWCYSLGVRCTQTAKTVIVSRTKAIIPNFTKIKKRKIKNEVLRRTAAEMMLVVVVYFPMKSNRHEDGFHHFHWTKLMDKG